MGPTGSIEVMLRSLTDPTIKDREVSLLLKRIAKDSTVMVTAKSTDSKLLALTINRY